MMFFPLAEFDALSAFDKEHQIEEYMEFGQGVLRVIEVKLGRFFNNEYPSDEETTKRMCNMIIFYIKKILESVNNENSNCFYIWMDYCYAKDHSYSFDHSNDPVDRQILDTMDDEILNLVKNGEGVFLQFKYVIIPKKIPICIYNYRNKNK